MSEATTDPRANTAIFDLEINDITFFPPARFFEIPGITLENNFEVLLGNP